MKRLHVLAGLTLGVAVLASGCSTGPSFGEVHGMVTLDGEPLAEGVVRFVPVDGMTPSAGAVIEGGQFNERVAVGRYRVEISSWKLPKGIKSSKEMKRGTVDEGPALEELIPERYNKKSELTADIKRGPNDLKFELNTKAVP